MTKLHLALALSASLMSSTAASAITYSGSFTATEILGGSGPLSANYTITTDGTLGALSASNYTGFTLSINDNGTIINGSGVGVFAPTLGAGGSATASTLSFNFDDSTNTLAFYTGSEFLCFAAWNGGCGPTLTRSSTIIAASTIGYLPRSSGVEVIGTAVSGAVPEPASWALLIAGFGLTGAVMRRRRRAISAA